MTHAALKPLIGPEFDDFLYASIGEDRNGTGLSVLSALARLNVDPRLEATSLARMPRDAAAARLTALIDGLPYAPKSATPSKTTVADLVALLPAVSGLKVRCQHGAFAALRSPRTQTLVTLTALAIIVLIIFANTAFLAL